MTLVIGGLLVPSVPYIGDVAGDWWRQVSNYADIVRSQPGVNTDTSENLPGMGDRVINIALYGSTSLENLYVIDGINTTNVIRGFQGKAINPESMQEVEIKTGGYQAEYGRSTGGANAPTYKRSIA